MATATQKTTSFDVTCPYCGDADSTVKIDLNNLEACTCTNCDEEFHPVDAVNKLGEQLARWEAVARWVEMAPTGK